MGTFQHSCFQSIFLRYLIIFITDQKPTGVISLSIRAIFHDEHDFPFGIMPFFVDVVPAGFILMLYYKSILTK